MSYKIVVILFVIFCSTFTTQAQVHVKVTGKPKPKVLTKAEMDSVSLNVVAFVDQEAEFPGGGQAFNAFIGRETKYPEVCLEEGIQGKVYLKFIIEADGSIGDISIIRGVHPLLDAEAIRIIRAMPRWIPGSSKGKVCRSFVQIPLSFRIG